MKRESYMNSKDLIAFLKIGILAGEAELEADKTPEKDWRKKLRTIATYAKQITDERLLCLEPKQLLAVQRRVKNTELRLYTSDQLRTGRFELNKPEEEITVNTEDFFDVVDMALLSCMKCPQGAECVKNCRMRPVYHRMGVMPMRTNPAEGECEFKHDNEVIAVTPQYQKLSERI